MLAAAPVDFEKPNTFRWKASRRHGTEAVVHRTVMANGQLPMTAIWRQFLLFLTTAKDNDLIRIIEYQRAELRILRAKLPKRLELTAAEMRLLLELGQAVGAKIKELVTIVSPRTFARWVAAANESKPTSERGSNGGRPPTAIDTRALVLRFAGENGWGYGRIVGELKKLGIAIGKSTVKAILREHGYDLGPNRGLGT